MYLVWSIEHRGWWKQNQHGYTTLTHRAGRFTERQATDILKQANRVAIEEVMVPAPSRDECQLDLDYPDR